MIFKKDKYIEVILSGGPDSSLLDHILTKASRFYEAAARITPALYEKGILHPARLGRPVVSIGNLTAGGTGKTPAAIKIAGMLTGMGFHPAILSRGYGGSLNNEGGLVSDGKTVFFSHREAGDEPCLMALALPGVAVAAGRNRALMGEFCIEKLNSDALILDDGFQHMALHRDINILLADAGKPFGNGRMLPRGPLREPVSQIKRADAIILTRGLPLSLPPPQWPGDRPVFRACHRPVGLFPHETLQAPGPVPENRLGLPLSEIKGKKAAVFSGIAGNEGFFESVHELGGKIAFKTGFADHHAYSPGEIESIFAKARKSGADFVLTTEKDAVRIGKIPEGGPPLFALSVEFSFYDPAGFECWLKNRMESMTENRK